MPEHLTPEPPPQARGPLNAIQISVLESEVIEAIRQVYDPEIPVNVYDLGLIYDVDINPSADVVVTMTLTSPACPVAESLPLDVENVVAEVPGVSSSKVTLVWDPPFSIDRIPDHIKLDLGLL